MSYKSQITGIWCGIISMNLFFAALLSLAHFFPFPEPSMTTQQTADLFVGGNSIGVRLGGMLVLFAIALTIPFYCVISAQMRRMGEGAYVYIYTQLTCGVLAVANILPAVMAWATAAYRSGRSPEIIQTLSDFSFIGMLLPVAAPFVQLFAIGLAILQDRSDEPVYPRWGAYLNFWGAILFLPGLLVCMFLTGPFSWRGVVGFWIPSIDFGLWTYTMAWLMYKEAKRSRNDEVTSR